MLNEKTLKNLWKNEFHPYLKSLDFKNTSNITRGVNGTDYRALISFLEDQLTNPTSKISKDNLDNFLYKKFFYHMNNYHYVYHLNSFFKSSDLTQLSSIEGILKKPDLLLNKNLVDVTHTTKNELCTTRIRTFEKDKVEYLKGIQLLFFIDSINTTKGFTNLYCCVDIDIVSRFVSFKFNSNVLENISNKNEIIDKIIKKIESSYDIFKDLHIEIFSHNETTIKRGIQTLFMELSSQAEKLLQSKVMPGIHDKINTFLKSIRINPKKENVKQIISVVYQDICKTFNKSLFNEGWVFRFVFKEGDSTRASSSTDDLEPVYGKQVYWNLKELMFQKNGTDFIEAGLLWNTNKNLEPVAVKLEKKNTQLIVQYYKKVDYNYKNREEKEEYVLRKIRKAF
jgi:hypothetical protein